MEGITKKNKELFAGRFHVTEAVGVVLCVLGVVPLLLFAAMEAEDFMMVRGVVILLVMVAIATFLFVWAGSIQDSFHKLLQSGDFSPEQKAISKKLGVFSGAYWCVVTAVFLVVYTRFKYDRSFIFESDKNSNIVLGMIWGVAALLFVAVRIVLKDVIRRKRGGQAE